MSIARSLIKGSAVRTLETLVGIAIGFCMLPYMVRHLGEDVYGLWIVVSGITSAFYIFDLGFASSITVFLTRFFTQKDTAAINRTLSTAFMIYCGLGGAILVAAYTASCMVQYWTVKPESQALASALILVTGASLALEFPFKAFAGVAVAHYRYDLVSWSRLVFKLVNTAATVTLLELGYGLLEVAWAAFFIDGFSNLVFYGIARYLYREMRVSPALASRDTVKSLLNFSLWTFAIDSASIIKNRADVFVVAALLSTNTLTIYYVGVRLVDYAIELMGKATNMTTPVFSRYHAEGDLVETRNKVVLISRINCMFGGLVLVGLVTLGMPFIKVWMGPEFDAQLAWQSMVWLLVGKLVFFMLTPVSTCLYVHGDHRYLAVMGLVEAIISVVLTYVLVRFSDLGIVGAAIGMTACYYLTRASFVAWRLFRLIEMSAWSFYRALFPILAYAVALCLGMQALPEAWRSPASYFEVVWQASVILLVFCLGLLGLFSREERRIIKGLLPARLAGKFQ